MSLIALDILGSGLARGNPFYPVNNKRRLQQKDYEDADLNFELFRPKDVPNKIFNLFTKLISRDPAKVINSGIHFLQCNFLTATIFNNCIVKNFIVDFYC